MYIGSDNEGVREGRKVRGDKWMERDGYSNKKGCKTKV